AGRLACTWRDIGRIVAALRRRSSKHEDAAIYREEVGRDVKDAPQYRGMHIRKAFGTKFNLVGTPGNWKSHLPLDASTLKRRGRKESLESDREHLEK
ncbi:hypothetical protein ALC60_02213, partial [Trachymyrmex zeteki]